MRDFHGIDLARDRIGQGVVRVLELSLEHALAAESAVVSDDARVEAETQPIDPEDILAVQGQHGRGARRVLCIGGGARRRRGAGRQRGGDAEQDRRAMARKAPRLVGQVGQFFVRAGVSMANGARDNALTHGAPNQLVRRDKGRRVGATAPATR